MNITDISKHRITDQMIEDAKKDQAFHNAVSVGQKTRADYDQRDLIGSLGHQIVEQYFQSNTTPPLTATSYRTERRTTGDDMDISFAGDCIDVKSTHGSLDEQYFYNKSFLVYDEQLKDPKFKVITHFIFVLVDMQLRIGYVYGIIDKSRFMQLCTPIQLKHANQQIRAFQLTPLHAYLYHKQNNIIDLQGVRAVVHPPRPFVDKSKADEPIDLASFNRVVAEKRAQLENIKKSV